MAKNDVKFDRLFDQVKEAQVRLPTDEWQGLTVKNTGTQKCFMSKGKIYFPMSATLLELSILFTFYCDAAGHIAQDTTKAV